MFYVLDLLGFLDGSTPCPAPTLVNNGVPSPNLAYTLWMRQDQLILHDILVFISEIAVPMVRQQRPETRHGRGLTSYVQKSHVLT